METNGEKAQPSLKLSLFLILSIIAILTSGIILFNADLHVLLIIALSFSCIVSYRLGYNFDELTGRKI